MALVTTNNEHYYAIAAAIRAKLSTEATYLPSEMAAAIRGIPTGGGRSPRAEVQSIFREADWITTWPTTATEEAS